MRWKDAQGGTWVYTHTKQGGTAERLPAEVCGDRRTDDLVHWRSDGGTAVAAGAGGEARLTARVPGACAALLEALGGCGFRIGELAVFLASRPFGRPEL